MGPTCIFIDFSFPFGPQISYGVLCVIKISGKSVLNKFVAQENAGVGWCGNLWPARTLSVDYHCFLGSRALSLFPELVSFVVENQAGEYIISKKWLLNNQNFINFTWGFIIFCSARWWQWWEYMKPELDGVVCASFWSLRSRCCAPHFAEQNVS